MHDSQAVMSRLPYAKFVSSPRSWHPASHTSKRSQRRAVHRARQATAIMHARLALPSEFQSIACLSCSSAQPSRVRHVVRVLSFASIIFPSVSVPRTASSARVQDNEEKPSCRCASTNCPAEPQSRPERPYALLPTVCAQLGSQATGHFIQCGWEPGE
ncbi:hypothetical protein BKA81DRAFT_75167 [Phyllosticta paracitricarpa]